MSGRHSTTTSKFLVYNLCWPFIFQYHFQLCLIITSTVITNFPLSSLQNLKECFRGYSFVLEPLPIIFGRTKTFCNQNTFTSSQIFTPKQNPSCVILQPKKNVKKFHNKNKKKKNVDLINRYHVWEWMKILFWCIKTLCQYHTFPMKDSQEQFSLKYQIYLLLFFPSMRHFLI